MEDEDSSLSDNEYYVERVLDKKIIDGEIHYKIKWEGWSCENATWEPLDNLKNIKNLIEAFEKEKREEKRKAAGKGVKPGENIATPSLSKKKPRAEDKMEENEKEEKACKQKERTYNLEYDIPEEIISVKKEKEQILCQVRFKERSDGITTENAYIPSSELKETYPKVLIDFYESRIKFVDKK